MRVREISVKYLRNAVALETRHFRNSREIFEAFKDLYLEPVEVFVVVILDSKNHPICYETISRGSLATSIVHPREVFWPAVHFHAAAIISVHNHPSGDPTPSREDRECTHRLVHAGKVLGIRVLDHVIVGESDYFSFADAGLLTEGE